MGQTASKSESEVSVITGSLPSTPILMPKQRTSTYENIIDPRSPSQNITRTPIQASSLPDSLEQSIRDTFNIHSPTLPSTKALSDPRSPTTVFHRTPIIIKDEDLLRSIHKKHLEGVRKVLSDLPPQETPKKHSVAGILETNIDYIETDLDAVMMENTSAASRTLLQQKEALEALNASQETIDDQIVDAIDEVAICNEKQIEEEEEVDDNPAKIAPLEVAASAEMQELENKLSNLIYSDENHVVTVPRGKCGDEAKQGHRTPLGIRNGNAEKKALPKLKVSDKPRRSQFGVSKIPRFRHSAAAQCENMPPDAKMSQKHKTVRTKSHNSLWDNDNTLVI